MDVQPLKPALARLAADAASEEDILALGAAAREGRLRLIQRKGGRRPIDDDASIQEMRVHVAPSCSVERASILVARSLRDQQSVTSTAKRLAKKYRRKFPQSETS